MKQLACEVCGSTDLTKQDGLFVCPICGARYTLEEVRKMLGMGGGSAPEAKPNSTQLANLMNLAKSSFDSKNYAQAEEFCNQAISLDGNNYEAWKLKGEAINYQITANNPRILEVYNCLMTAYRTLSETEKAEKRFDILASLNTCFEGEIDFWIKQFEAGRPTNAALIRVKNAYIDAYNKMGEAFTELGLEDSKEGYLTNFDNLFIGKCNAICNSAWQTTVGYNYYRDYMGSKDPFSRTDQRWVIKNTDLYRPMKNTWDTFLEEADNLIALLQYAEGQFNDDTDPDVMKAICENIAFFEECIIPSGSWHITTGYTGNWDEYKSVGWHEEYSLAVSAKDARRKIMNEYKRKAVKLPEQAAARQRAKEEKARQERIAKYWEAHPTEKAELDNELAAAQERIANFKAKITEIDKKNLPKVKELTNKKNEELPCEVEMYKQEDLVHELGVQRDKCGIFKAKEKKAIQTRLDEVEYPKLNELRKKAEEEKKAHKEKIQAEINALRAEGKELHEEVEALETRCAEIEKALNMDR